MYFISSVNLLIIYLGFISCIINVGKLSHLKVVWVGGSHTSILTPYLKSTGLFTPGVKFSTNSVQPLQRYYNIQGHCHVGTENLNLGNPSVLMT